MITNKEELHKLFPLKCTTILTDGVQAGVVLKFKTFYLKIYDDKKEDSYTIHGFRYHEQNPVFVENIRSWRMRDFASRFTKENHLIPFQKPCGDPYCIFRHGVTIY